MHVSHSLTSYSERSSEDHEKQSGDDDDMLTFDLDFCLVLDAAKVGRRDASVGGRLPDVTQRQHVATERRVVLRCQVDGSETPAYRRHRRPDCDARKVDRSSG